MFPQNSAIFGPIGYENATSPLQPQAADAARRAERAQMMAQLLQRPSGAPTTPMAGFAGMMQQGVSGALSGYASNQAKQARSLQHGGAFMPWTANVSPEA